MVHDRDLVIWAGIPSVEKRRARNWVAMVFFIRWIHLVSLRRGFGPTHGVEVIRGQS
jgi:hypothetical protein